MGDGWGLEARRSLGEIAMKVLITGGAGFLGSHLTDAFLDRGDEVFILDTGMTVKVKSDNSVGLWKILVSSPNSSIARDGVI